jgi:hypothetical protein
MRKLLALAPLGLLAGCYNIITLNVGGVQKQAAGAGIPPPPEVQCAALTHGVDIETDKGNMKAVQLCEEMLAKKAAAEKKASH